MRVSQTIVFVFFGLILTSALSSCSSLSRREVVNLLNEGDTIANLYVQYNRLHNRNVVTEINDHRNLSVNSSIQNFIEQEYHTSDTIHIRPFAYDYTIEYLIPAARTRIMIDFPPYQEHKSIAIGPKKYEGFGNAGLRVKQKFLTWTNSIRTEGPVTLEFDAKPLHHYVFRRTVDDPDSPSILYVHVIEADPDFSSLTFHPINEKILRAFGRSEKVREVASVETKILRHRVR